MKIILIGYVLWWCCVPISAEALPLKGGEKVLFIGNSLTASLSESLNTAAVENELPAFLGHRVQLWNETFETHVLLSPEQTPNKFKEGESRAAGMKGYQVKSSFNSLWKQGVYDRPEFLEKGYITSMEAIKNGTPEGQPWDVVVLQGYGGASEEGNRIEKKEDGTLVTEGAFMIHGSTLIEAAKAQGAQPVLYMAWLLNPEKGGGNENPESYYNQKFDLLIKSYQDLAAAHEIPVVPVGEIMRYLSAEGKPEKARTAWLIRDNVHGTAAGQALLHYAMLDALYGRAATELNYRFDAGNNKYKQGDHYKIGDPEKRYQLVITEEIDQAIKEAVERFNREYGWEKADQPE